MTMDVTNRKLELKTEVQITKGEEQTEIVPNKTVKRPFDVAFLMLPDDKLKQKQTKIEKCVSYANEFPIEDVNCYNNNDKTDSEEEIEVGTNNDIQKPSDFVKIQNHTKYLQRQQIFDDPNLIKPKISLSVASDQKSAFTKVNLSSKESRLSPNLSISPDLSYQNSLSPSPPILNRNYQNFPTNMLSPNQIFKTHNVAYQNNFIQENLNNFSNSTTSALENPFIKTNPNHELLQPNFSKMRPMLTHYRPELNAYNYQQFPAQDMLKIAQPELKFSPEMRNPAAALLTSLLPPSLAALSLPAQNVCAKCNITFRMTSDLVYHMRSHHKNDSVDFCRKRREDKLKCPVCSESFRERHHLTRHMTAHQDKDDDGVEPEIKKKTFANYAK